MFLARSAARPAVPACPAYSIGRVKAPGGHRVRRRARRWAALATVVAAAFLPGLFASAQAETPQKGRFEGDTSFRFSNGQAGEIDFRVDHSRRPSRRRITNLITYSGCRGGRADVKVRLRGAKVSSRGRISGKDTGGERTGFGNDSVGDYDIHTSWSLSVTGRFASARRAKGSLRITTTVYRVDRETGERRPEEPGDACTHRWSWGAKATSRVPAPPRPHGDRSVSGGS